MAACLGNPGKGGWAAVIIEPSGEREDCWVAKKFTTNNRMELMAVIRGLKRNRS
jgi:ribonuclease HI